MDWTAAGVSLRLALAATSILAVFGIPLAWWLARSRSRLRPFVDAVVALPLVLPPTVVGYYLLLATAPDSPAGRALAAVTGSTLPFTFPGIVLGAVIGNLPFAVRPFAAAFAAVDPRALEAAWCLGASKGAAFRRIALPLAAPGLAAGGILTFAHTLGEFGVVLMLGGNIPGVTRTLSIAIYDDVQALDAEGAAATASALVACAAAVLVLVHALDRRRRR